MPVPDAPVSELVEAFESAALADPSLDVAAFAPPPGSPNRAAVLAELIRVDLERRWRAGTPDSLAGYQRRFPEAFAAEFVGGLAFEEYRQRRLAGEQVSPVEYRERYGIEVAHWPAIPAGSLAHRYQARVIPPASSPTWPVSSRPAATFRLTPPAAASDTPSPALSGAVQRSLARLARSSPESTARWQSAQRLIPQVGSEFLGFHLGTELGRGAFGRVFLARQSDLSGRPVALKVACDAAAESRHLARLQHTNIVPIYSFHRAGPLHAVCMPYFGRVTLAEVLASYRRSSAVPKSGKELKSIVVDSSRTAMGEAAPPPAAPAEPGEAWVRVEACDYPRAVVWLGLQMADALAHAHARGILHRDLKPANVLIADDGRPMLLDFNLAEDVALRNTPEAAAMGGTLPYMSPEQLRAFAGDPIPLDGRTDIFSLGVILYELLTGRRPHPDTDFETPTELAAMLAERSLPPPSARSVNPAIPWALEAILRRCLAPEPRDRYPTALALREDLEREMADRPLALARNPSIRERGRKWFRRNPALTSSGMVAAVAAVLLAVAVAGWSLSRERARTLEDGERFAEHLVTFQEAQASADDRTLTAARAGTVEELLAGVLDRYGVSSDTAPEEWQRRDEVARLSAEDRRRLRDDLGEACFLRANLALQQAARPTALDPNERLAAAAQWNAAAARFGDRIPRAVLAQQARIAEARRDGLAATRTAEALAGAPAVTARDHYLTAYGLWSAGRAADALADLKVATQLDATNFSAWFVRGQVHLALEQPDLAAVSFGSCLALRPDFAPAWLNRGLAHASARRYADARDDYDQALSRRPEWAEAYLQRATVRSLLGDPRAADADLTAALACGDATPRLHFLRASVRQHLGDAAGAAADRAAGMARVPADELSWIARAEQRVASDPTAALADVDEALRLNPVSPAGLQLKAHLLAERLGRPRDALAVLDVGVRNYPDLAVYRVGRAVLLARRGEFEAARADARAALDRDGRAPILYAAGCVFALTAADRPDDRDEALRLIRQALKGGFGAEFVDKDPDLNALRADPEFPRLVDAVRRLDTSPRK